jgi:hypothetical protein
VSFIAPAEDECLLEDIQFTGTAHVVLHFTESASGNILDRFMANDQNFAGVGLTTGTRYRRVGATQQTVQVNTPLPLVVSFTDTFHFIGQGRAPNLLIKQTFHFTINAPGVVTAEVDNGRVECK